MVSASQSVRLDFQPLSRGDIALLTLTRPEVSNALSGEMIERMTQCLADVKRREGSVRLLVVRGEGKHFSAGADLAWMKESASLSYEANLAEAGKLSKLFHSLAGISVPTLAVVQGAIYGGGVGLVACCDWAVALDNARFCLSEVRVGLLPATILPFLARKMASGQLRRYGLCARPFTAAEAMSAGLVQRVVSASEKDDAIRDEISHLLAGEPGAQRVFKALHQRLVQGPEDLAKTNETLMIESIAAARVGAGGQAGLQAFFQKRSAEWVIELPADWHLMGA